MKLNYHNIFIFGVFLILITVFVGSCGIAVYDQSQYFGVFTAMKLKTPDKYTLLTLIFGVIAGFGLIEIGKILFTN
jgi:hypothetical protein